MFDFLIFSSISSTVIAAWMGILVWAAVLDGRTDSSHHVMS